MNAIKNQSSLTALNLPLSRQFIKRVKKCDPSNYRPISSLPILSKIFELDMKNQMMSYIEKHNLFSDQKFGFRQNHSTEQMLLSVLQQWKTKLDQSTPCYIGALSLDVRKAFDTINHKLLLYILDKKQFSSSAIALLRSYLQNQSQVMKVGLLRSNSEAITCRVPQGSILGPILFNLAINGLLATFDNSFAYADDTLIYCTATSIDEVLVESNTLLKKSIRLVSWPLTETQH
jgi:retron-type reverse transcriptase